jgi:hypothetical protein
MTDDDRSSLRQLFGDFAMMILIPMGVFAFIGLVCIVLLLQPPSALPHAPPETVPQASMTLPAAEPHADFALAPPADQVSGAFLPSGPGRSAADPPSVMAIVSSPQTDTTFADFASLYAPPSESEPTRPERKPRQPQLRPRHWHWRHYPSAAQAEHGEAARLMRVELQQRGIAPFAGGYYGAARHRREASATQDQYRNH